MPKRSHENESDYLRRKLAKIKKKLAAYDNSEVHLQVPSNIESANVSPGPIFSDPEQDETQEPIYDDLVPTMEFDEQPGTSIYAAEVINADTPLTPPIEVPVQAEPPGLDEEILCLLGDTPTKDKRYGPDIREELAVRWEHIATSGLTKESRKDLLDKHPVPKNCTKIDTPKLNPEIKAALSEWLIKKDKALENKQKQIASGITCISEALTRLFDQQPRDQTVIRLLVEAGRILCDTQFNESMTRRSFICSTIKKDIKDHLYNTEIDCYLFGEKLADTLKAAKAISKSGAEMKIPQPKGKNPTQRPRLAPATVNQRPPLPAVRQPAAARRYEPSQPTMSRSRQSQQQRQPPRSQRQPPPRR